MRVGGKNTRNKKEKGGKGDEHGSKQTSVKSKIDMMLEISANQTRRILRIPFSTNKHFNQQASSDNPKS